MNMQDMSSVFVIGALNLDMCGLPQDVLRMYDSNPGRITISAGGVAHNIAYHLAQAGIEVELVSLLGDDYAANILSRHCSAENIHLHHTARYPGPSSTYLCIHNEKGEMVAAINDMSLIDHLSPAFIEQRLPEMAGAPLIITDANLPKESLATLAHEAKAPLMLDPVSGFKALRAKDIIGRFAIVKPNALEAKELTGESDPAKAAEWLLEQNVKQVYISLGAEGVYYASRAEKGFLPATKMKTPSTTGAGDAMTAGIAIGYLQGKSPCRCAQSGIETVTRHLLKQGGRIL